MRVLVGCEESGTVRDAFRARGHDAWSNDLTPTSTPSAYHLQCDVNKAICDYGPWDIIILHPPCTALCVSGNSTYARGQLKYSERVNALIWTADLWETAKKHARVGVLLENPVGVLWPALGVIPQYIHPWAFGHPESKKTGLALDRLPKLKPTKIVYREMLALPKHKRERIHYMSPGPERAKLRSKTFQGIADAFADQYGGLL